MGQVTQKEANAVATALRLMFMTGASKLVKSQNAYIGHFYCEFGRDDAGRRCCNFAKLRAGTRERTYTMADYEYAFSYTPLEVGEDYQAWVNKVEDIIRIAEGGELL